jgi:hypothetical protein
MSARMVTEATREAAFRIARDQGASRLERIAYMRAVQRVKLERRQGVKSVRLNGKNDQGESPPVIECCAYQVACRQPIVQLIPLADRLVEAFASVGWPGATEVDLVVNGLGIV